MNLRISESELRFRITSKELDLLLKEGELTQILKLIPGCDLSYAISVVDQMTMKLEKEGEILKLILPKAELLNFRERLPAKEGLIYSWETFKIKFEVDVRKEREPVQCEIPPLKFETF